MEVNSDIFELRTLLCGRCRNEFVVSCTAGVPLEILRSSSIPSEPEKATQLELLDVEANTLRQYDEQIEEITETLRKLQSERNSLQKRMDSREQYLSSQRRLPVELWTRIFFQACYPIDMEAPYRPFEPPVPFVPIYLAHNDNKKTRALPLLLSRVSHRWRSIISDFPVIWSSIGVSLYWLSASTLPIFEAFLMKTRGQPLRLRLAGDEGACYHWDDSLASDIRRLLCRAFSQSQRLEISRRFLESFDFQGQVLSFPLLQSLIFGSYALLTDFPFSKSQLGALCSAPLLTRLFVHALSESDVMSLPSTITSLELWDPVDIEDLHSVARVLPRLKELKITLSDDGVPEGHTDQPLVFPCLESLEIENHLTDPVDHFLNRLTIPSLINFSFGLGQPISDDNNSLPRTFVSSLVGLLERSGCSLRSLSLLSPFDDLSYDTDYRTKWIQDILQLSPHLTSLSFTMVLPGNDVDILNSTFYRLWSLLTVPSPSYAAPVDSSSVLLPRLYAVRIEIVNYVHLVENEDIDSNMVHQFLRMVESRTRRTVPSGVDVLRRAELILVSTAQEGIVPKPMGLDETEGVCFVDEFRRRRRALVEDGVGCSIRGY
ncbi:hypothetical protein V5O48_011731 [Marasmius crinis-equi]|uniref:F-box domain-containing protein n=1 Tax=Marasmius crinis-equi TaxID=585013 RepID=A0ABR3F4U4_9AGAR